MLVTLSGCWAPPPSVVVTVTDPLELAAAATHVAAGTVVNGLFETELNGKRFPVSVTLVDRGNGGPRDVWIEAHTADDTVVARGYTKAIFARSTTATSTVALSAACEAGFPNGSSCVLPGLIAVNGVCIHGVCEPSRCTDGFVDPNEGEECDDGNDDNNDGCLAVLLGDTMRCYAAKCGDGSTRNDVPIDQGGEACDDGGRCANGDRCVVHGALGCADASACAPRSGDGCPEDCRKTEHCGDGVLDVGEACDDGNDNPNDGCYVADRGVDASGCSRTRWEPEVVTGFGPSGGEPLKQPLRFPSAITFDRDGNLFIADTWNHRIRRVDAGNDIVTTVAGDGAPGFRGDGGPAGSAHLRGPAGVAVDGLGNVYVADERNNRVRKVDAETGIIATVAGNGVRGYSGDGGPAFLAGLNRPFGVVVDGQGNLFIADRLNSRVRRVDSDTQIITTYAGGGTLRPGDGELATNAQLLWPAGIALDHDGNLLIAEQVANRVRRVDARTRVLTTVAGGGSTGLGDGGPATAAELHVPTGVAVDPSGNVYVADTESFRVRRVDASSAQISTVAGGGAGALGDNGLATAATLGEPWGVAVSPTGAVFLADTNNHRIRRVDAQTKVITTFAGTGAGSYGGDGGSATAAALREPWGLSLTAAGDVYIADSENHRIRRVDHLSQRIATVAGDGRLDFAGDGLPALRASFSLPSAVIAAASGDLLIADQWNDRIRRVDHATGIIVTIAGGGVSGLGDGGPADRAVLRWPNSFALSPDGRLLIIADTGQDRLRQVDLDGGGITTIAGIGSGGFSGDDDLATLAELHEPWGVAIAANGDIYVADTLNDRIRKIDATSKIITTVAGGAARGFGGDGGPATLASLWYPTGVAVDSQGNVYIADTLNDRVRVVDADDQTIATVAGTGVAGRTGDGGPAALAALSGPRAVVVDDAGRLYIADAGNSRIRMVDTGSPRLITTVVGAVDPEGDGPLAQAALAAPTAWVALDDGARVLVADGGAGRLRLIDFATETLTTVVGYPDYLVDSQQPSDSARFSRLLAGVSGMAYVPSQGAVWLSEHAGHSLRRVSGLASSPPAWTVATLAGTLPRALCCNADDVNECTVGELADPSCADDSPAYDGDTGGLATARFDAPAALAYEPSDPAQGEVLYVADSANPVIRRIALLSGAMTTIAGIPRERGYFGDGEPAATALLYDPSGLAIGPSPSRNNGSLYVADTGNSRIRRIDLDSGVIFTVLGDGTAATSGAGAPASFFPIDRPTAVAVDHYGNLVATAHAAVRMVYAGADGVATGDDSVITIYGEAPRDRFPMSATKCLGGIGFDPRSPDEGSIYVMDACQGFMLRLRRTAAP
ncbi:MAG: hypothetical protein HY903_19560 [Deltaproteobacteria bacterium]|nr:hypothetical protein [Deltaproteobacteria bacterium]